VVCETGEKRCCEVLNEKPALHTGNSEPDVYTTCDATEFFNLMFKVNVFEYNRII